MHRNLAVLTLLGLATAGCVGLSTGPMAVPVITPPPAAGLSSDAASGYKNQASFRLDRVVVGLPRGTVVAHYPHRFWEKWEYRHYCNGGFGPDAIMEWGSGTEHFGSASSEAGEIFYTIMRRYGANVVGDPRALFQKSATVQSAEFLIGGRITDIKGNICHRHFIFTEKPLHQYLGEFYVKVEWEVFSSLSRRVVYKFQTEGYAETKKPMENGVEVTLLNAFAMAVKHAASDSGFRKLLERDATQTAGPLPARLSLAGRALYQDIVADHIAELADAAVTIELGSAHGSGFLISHDGHLLTNAHVVGDGKVVPVAFRNGVRVNGTVLRVAPRRDIALIKIPVSVSHVLPIRRGTRPRIGDDVYVVGSPFDPSLRSTVTKGIVSALRTVDGQPFIQADAAVTVGNSGGPLVDAQGNVIGITVLKVVGGENLNLFIPIDDALKALNLTIEVD